MKKLFIPAILVLGLVAFTNCNKNKKTASAAAREYSEHLRDGRYDNMVVRMVADNDYDAAEMRRDSKRYSEMIQKNADEHVRRNGGIKNVKVVSENVSKDKKTANVVVRHDYNNGVAEDVAYDMAFVDNEWKVKMGPNKEVWKTQLADGTHVTFKLKENDNKEVFKQHIGDERDFIKVKDSDDRHVLKVKDDGEKDVVKVIEKDDEIVVKEKHDGEKTVQHIDK